MANRRRRSIRTCSLVVSLFVLTAIRVAVSAFAPQNGAGAPVRSFRSKTPINRMSSGLHSVRNSVKIKAEAQDIESEKEKVSKMKLSNGETQEVKDSKMDWESKYSSRGSLGIGAWKLQGLRDTMEDQFSIIEKARCGFLYASVFDGHGGDAASEYLKQHLYQVFSDAIEKELPVPVAPLESESGLSCPIELTKLLTGMFEKTDKNLLKHLSTIVDEEQSRSGSTATVALVRKDRIIVANVGDSRAVLGRGEWAIDLSKEHRAYGDTDITWNEICRIEETGAWVDDGRVLDILGITRAFGDPDFKGEGLLGLKRVCVDNGYWAKEFAENLEFSGDPIIVTPDVTEIAVTPEDSVLVVASDGLWDAYESEEAIWVCNDMLKKGESPQAIARTLCETAIEYGSEDNVAVVVIDLRRMHGGHM